MFNKISKIFQLTILAITLLANVSVIAQNQGDVGASLSTEEYTKAQSVVSEVLGIQAICEEPFLNAKSIQDCINLEIGGFIDTLNTIDEGLKNQLTPLRDSTRLYPGVLYNKEELEILPIEIAPTPSYKTGCVWNYSVLKAKGKPAAKTYTVTFETCGLDITTNKLLEIRNGIAVPKLSGNIEIRTPFIGANQTFYLIS
jgi:hypothetical protein